jgi:PPM family protein phosphatase
MSDMSPAPDLEPLRLRAACASDVGRVRRANEDAALADPEARLLVVADGMGGHNAGADASRFVVRGLPQLLGERLPPGAVLDTPTALAALSNAVIELNQRMRESTRGRPELAGMGATLACAVIRGRTALLAHLGDSRIYLLRAGVLTQLSDDHSAAAMLVRAGELSASESRLHPGRSMLARYMGMEGVGRPDVQALPLAPGDRLLLCSDGLWGMLDDPSLLALMSLSPDPAATSATLVNQANAAGGNDNITAVVGDLD